MNNKHFSDDNWLVLLLAVAIIGAFGFFYHLPGSLTENLGLSAPVHHAQVIGVTKVVNNDAEEKSDGKAFGPFDDPEAIPARDGRGVFEGELFITVGESFEDGEVTKAEYFYTLYDRVTGIVLDLKPDGELPPGLEAGAMLRARGVVEDGTLELSNTAATGADGSVELLQPAEDVAGAASARSVLAILANTTDKGVGCSVDQVSGILFSDAGNNVAEAFESASLGAMTIAGDVVGPFNVSYSSTDNYQLIGNEAQAIAQANGIDTSAYDHIINVLPPNSTNNYLGWGQYNSRQTWILRCGSRDTYEHEIGHNLNLGHANRGTNEYNDRGSFMGYGNIGLRHTHAPHMDYLNWLPESAILRNPAPGQYTISSSDVRTGNATHPQAIVIGKPDTYQQYYVSYRTPTGYANKMPAEYDYKIQVHTEGPTNRDGTNFVFLSPTTPFVDAANGVTISQIGSTGGDTVTIEVSTNCTANTPTVTLNPAEVGSSPGGSAVYTATVTNNDSLYCGSSSIDLTSSAGSDGLSTSLAQSSVNLAAGESTMVALTATSDSTLTGDEHTVTVTATKAGKSGSASALYVIDGTPPSVPTNVSAGAKRKQVNVTWNASSDNVGVVGYEVLRNGSVIGTTESTSYADRDAVSGSNEYQVRAYDATGNVSDLSEIATVDFGGSSSGGGGGGSTGGGGKTDKCSPWPSCRNQ